MKFSEAIERLMNGEKVRSTLWNPTWYIEYDSDACGAVCLKERSYDPCKGVLYFSADRSDLERFFTLKDVMAEWEIYDR